MYKLSKTSKMPGKSFSLPTSTCKVGSILSMVKGSVCSSCYAKKGSYCYPAVKDLRQSNYDTYKDNSDAFYPTMKTIIEAEYLQTGVGFFRWFDSGDIQSKAMLMDIIRIAHALPKIKFWLPTKEIKVVYEILDFMGLNNIPFPDNLNIRCSVFMIDGEYKQFVSTLTQSRVITDESKLLKDEILCSGQCVSCNYSCWLSTKSVAYLKH